MTVLDYFALLRAWLIRWAWLPAARVLLLIFPSFEFHPASPPPTLFQLSLRIDRIRALPYLFHQPCFTEYLPTNNQGTKLLIRQLYNLPTTHASSICSCARTVLYTPYLSSCPFIADMSYTSISPTLFLPYFRNISTFAIYSTSTSMSIPLPINPEIFT